MTNIVTNIFVLFIFLLLYLFIYFCLKRSPVRFIFVFEESSVRVAKPSSFVTDDPANKLVRLSATNIRRRLSLAGKCPPKNSFWLALALLSTVYTLLKMLVKDKRSSLFVRNVSVEERTVEEIDTDFRRRSTLSTSRR